MAKQKRYTEMMGDWQNLHGRVEANLAELPQLVPYLAKLGAVLVRALEVTRRQGAMAAAKQEASKEMRKLSSEGNRLATLVRQALKEHYGIREEKLSEFGLQPFRGLNRKKQDAEEPDSPETPPPVSPDAIQPVE
jgi:hypothetical protein